ncbi:MAG: hypothetical protein RL076_1733 [Chloroflexota bacterium]
MVVPRLAYWLGVLVVLVCALWPASATVDVGAYDAPWVSDTYNVQVADTTTYRWTYPTGHLQLFALGGGQYQLTATLRTTDQATVALFVDDVPVTTWHVTNQWAPYTATLHIPMQWDGNIVVAVRCGTATFDGERPTCVAIDRVEWHARGWVWPPIWPTLFLVMLLAIAIWMPHKPWQWWLVVASSATVVCFGRELVAMATPVTAILVGAAMVIVVTRRMPSQPGWQITQMSALMLMLVTIRHALYGNVGLMLEDEGFVWYGSQRLLLGELPMRDFFGYDVPRFVWNAIVMLTLNRTDIGALRIALTLCEWLILTLLGAWALLVRLPWRSWLFVALVAMVITWLSPRHKLYDHVVIWMLVIAGERWMQQPSVRRAWWLGVIIGVLAMIGRNHGLYGAGAGALLIGAVWLQPLAWRQRLASALWCVAGAVVGFLPMLVLMAVAPGFGEAYLRELVILVSRRDLNLPVPIPWPWQAESVVLVLRRLWYSYPMLVYAATAIWIIVQRWKTGQFPAAWLAPLAVGIPYLHVYVSRADSGHLAQSIAPALLLTIMWLRMLPAQWATGVATLLCVWSLWASQVTPWQTSWLSRGKTQQEVTVGDQQLTLPNAVATNVVLLDYLHDTYGTPDGAFVVTPYWPGAYAVYNQQSPLFYNYLLFRYDSGMQQREIARVTAMQPRFILIDDRMIDGNPQWQFRAFMPELDAYITRTYRRVADAALPETMRLYVP